MSEPIDTACRKCKAPMGRPVTAPLGGIGAIGRASFTVTGFRCEKCGHFNDLKARKPRAAK